MEVQMIFDENPISSFDFFTQELLDLYNSS